MGRRPFIIWIEMHSLKIWPSQTNSLATSVMAMNSDSLVLRLVDFGLKVHHEIGDLSNKKKI